MRGYELAEAYGDAFVFGPLPRAVPCRCGTLVPIDTPLLICERCASQLLETIRSESIS